MPAWMITALKLLGGGAAFGAGEALIGGELARRAPGGFIDAPFDILGDDKKRRRRRRKALTASDRADIAFIEATLGKAAGRSFAMLVVSRTAS